MDIYLAETRADGVRVYRDRSRAEAPIVGFLGSPAAIRDVLAQSRDPDIVLEWEIYGPLTRVRRPATGVPYALCSYHVAPQNMAGDDPSIEWAPIDYQEMLELIGDG